MISIMIMYDGGILTCIHFFPPRFQRGAAWPACPLPIATRTRAAAPAARRADSAECGRRRAERNVVMNRRVHVLQVEETVDD